MNFNYNTNISLEDNKDKIIIRGNHNKQAVSKYEEKKQHFASVTSDGLIIKIFDQQPWYEHIALPIVGLGTVLLEIIFVFAIKLKSSLLIKTAISFALETCASSYNPMVRLHNISSYSKHSIELCK